MSSDVLEELKEQVSFDKRVYGIKDVKTNKFAPPFLAETDGEAKRIFSDLVLANPESLLSKHPEDYDLFSLGVFDCVTGCHTGVSATYMLRASDVIEEYRKKLSSLHTSSPDNEELSSSI